MSWEDQGRQYHQWFGHGTASGIGATASADMAGAIGTAATEAMGVRGGVLAHVLAEGGMKDLRDALPVWTASSSLPPERFRALLVGRGSRVKAAASLQAMAQMVAEDNDTGRTVDVRSAGAHLAMALADEREERWRYRLNYARDKAVYAAEQELVPSGRERPASSREVTSDGGTSSGTAPVKAVQSLKTAARSRLAALSGISPGLNADEQPAPATLGNIPLNEVPPGYDAIVDDFGRIMGYQRHEITVVQGYVGGAAAALLLAGPVVAPLVRSAVGAASAEIEAAALAAAKARVKAEAALLRKLFRQTVDGARQVLAEVEAGTFRLPTGVTKELLDDYALVARNAIEETAASGKQAALTKLLQELRLEIIAKIRGIL